MKKYYSYILMALVSFFASIFVSCERDPDVDEAIALSGEWTGDLGMYYSDGYYEYDAEYSDIRFIPDYNYATYGTGEEIDFFNSYYCPIRYQSFYFEWQIRNGYIYLHFPYNSQLDIAIADYYLTTSYFSGRMGNTSFRLRKLVDYYDWYLYDRNSYYGYGYWDDYYYGKSRVNAAPQTQTTVSDSIPTVEPEKFSFGRRFNEK